MVENGVRLWVGSDDFNPGVELESLATGDHTIGAIASFIGLVRGAANQVSAMTLEHYPGMTERQIGFLIATARQKWRLDRVTVLHRVGRLLPGDRIVFVGVAARHRGDAIDACEFLIDWLKTRAPFWKLEEGPSGEHWVAARDEDEEKARQWEKR
jgi:molybdopterin synthase catalytic subunit